MGHTHTHSISHTQPIKPPDLPSDLAVGQPDPDISPRAGRDPPITVALLLARLKLHERDGALSQSVLLYSS